VVARIAICLLRNGSGGREFMTMNAAEYVLMGGIARGGADKLALASAEERLTYRELLLRVGRFAAGLRAAGLRRLDRVALLMLDTPDLVALHLATMAAGGIAIALSGRSSPDELRRALALVQPFAVVVGSEFAALAAQSIAAEALHSRVIRRDRELGAWKAGAPSDFSAQGQRPGDAAFWVMTSGTTGDPKAVEHRHDNVLTCTNYFDAALTATAADRFFATSRLHFSYALGTVFGALRIGATVVLHEHWPTPQAVADTIAAHRPTIVLTVPTLYHKLLEAGLSQQRAFAGVRRYVSAGERLPPKIAGAWEKATGQPILDALGCSETVYKILTNTPGRRRAGSSGMPVAGVEVRLVGEDGAAINGGGSAGMLEVRIASLCSGYRTGDQDPHGPPQRPSDRFKPDGWFATGDRYWRDDHGFFHHCGRNDDMLKVAGVWVSPSEIEDALTGIPSIAEVAAVAAKNAAGLSEIVLHVVPATGFGAEQAIAAARARLAGALPTWKLPKRFMAAVDLPRTPTGKMQRHKLRQHAAIPSLQVT
jgi:3-hydroxybenzoate/4-hydroxybenzoate---CoA ligase